MMKGLPIRHTLVLVWALGYALFATAQVQVEQRIDSLQMLIGEQTVLHLRVNLKKGTNALLPHFQPSQQITEGVEVLAQKDIDTTELDNGMVTLGRDYVLTSFDEKLYAIPPLPVKVNGKTYKGNMVALKILTVPVDTLHPGKFYPPKPVQPNPFLWSEWKGLFVMSVISLLLLVAVVYLVHRLRHNKPVIAKIRFVRRIPAHEAALREIEDIKKQHVESQESQKVYYTKLTDTLRGYIVKRFGFNAMEMTSSEIIERLRQEKDQAMIEELRNLFQTADLVKFAKYETLINENDRNLVNAIDFIDQTKTNEVVHDERVKEQLSAADVKSQKTRRLTQAFIIVAGVGFLALVACVVYGFMQLMM